MKTQTATETCRTGAIHTSANAPIAEVQAVAADVQAILASSGIAQDTIVTITTDMQAIVTEFQAKHA